MSDQPTQPVGTWQRNRELVKAAVSVVTADGRIEPAEFDFLMALCSNLGIDLDEATSAMRKGEKPSPEALRRGSDEDRIEALRVLVQASLADGEVAEQEKAILVQVGAALQVDRAAIERLLLEPPPEPGKTATAPGRTPVSTDPRARAREIVKAAFLVIRADGRVVPPEAAYMARLGARLGVSVAEVQRLSDCQDPVRPELLAGSSEAQRMECFELLMGAALADKELHERERVLLQNLARAMEVDPGLVTSWPAK